MHYTWLGEEIVQIFGGITPPPLVPPAKTENGAVNPFLEYACEPAPMGISDYGIGPNGAPYKYATNSSLGVIHFNSFVSSEDTIQQNVVLQFVTRGQPYEYWVQNVAQLSPSGDMNANQLNTISYETNIWNFSGPPVPDMSSAVVSGANGSASGDVYTSSAGNNEAGNNIVLTLPATVELRVNSSTVLSGGKNEPVVTFQYNDGVGGWQTYDTVTFLLDATSMPGYIVDGTQYNPYGLFDNAELTFGGPGSGSDTMNALSDLQMQLLYWNGHNYQSIPSAFNFGSDTAESIANVVGSADYYSDNGTLYNEVTAGPGSLGQLWDQQVTGQITLLVPRLSSGTIAINDKGKASAVSAEYGFNGGEAIFTIFPGTYVLKVYTTSGTLFQSTTVTVQPGGSVTATA
jgi:Thermopsin